MDLDLLKRRSDYEWEIPQHGAMRVPAVIYAAEQLMRDMDHKVYEQAVSVATLAGIVRAYLRHAGCALGVRIPRRA